MRFVVKVILLCTCTTTLLAGDSKTEHEFVRVLNELRANPKAFIPKIDEYLNDWRSFVPNKKQFESAVKEAKRYLKKAKPLPPLTLDSNLALAAADHAKDSKQMGVLGHIGSDGSNPLTRIERYAAYQTVGEVITYGQSGAADMLAAFIVDHDTPDRGHRKSLMSADYNAVGVAIDSHPKMQTQCVAVLAKAP